MYKKICQTKVRQILKTQMMKKNLFPPFDGLKNTTKISIILNYQNYFSIFTKLFIIVFTLCFLIKKPPENKFPGGSKNTNDEKLPLQR